MMGGSEVPDVRAMLAALADLGWSKVEASSDRYSLWDAPGGSWERILVPEDANSMGFSAALERATAQFMRLHGVAARRALDEASLVLEAALELARWRKETPDGAGVIAWDDGQALFESARAQLVASAKSAVKPKRYHGGSSYYVANEFMKRALMGQTDVGSFIVNAHVPSHAQFFSSDKAARLAVEKPGDMLPDMVQISGSDVMAVFDRALSTLSESVERMRAGAAIEELLDAVDDGVSHELVRAVTEVAAGSGVTIEIDRSPGRVSRAATRTHEFDPADASELSRAATFLASAAQPREVTLIGPVTLLSRDPDTDEQVVRIHAVDGRETRKARVRLDDEQYEIALDAHRADKPLVVTGTLEKEGHSFWLYNPTSIAVVEAVRPSRAKQVQGEFDLNTESSQTDG
ncbi:hypothetical protein [Demequina gelatinilytica]|uniref:hypothetical protein n=1 Tax=Demequina gelatinilytica TaxID=1638980 RepID=UPI000781923A|nr:hypothetical protein [Demequina gelatinilytica]